MSLAQIRRLIDNFPGLSSGFEDLIWFPSMGIGWYPIGCESMYDDEYFEKFKQYRTSTTGRDITAFRVRFVDEVFGGEVVDVGVGTGHFIDERGHGNTRGYDISKFGLAYLKRNKLLVDPYTECPQAITCWDSLEHIRDCWRLVESAQQYVFLSIPICNGPDHALSYRHYKPNEHWWHFTRGGLLKCFWQLGFDIVKMSSFESEECGRVCIKTFAFKRR